MKKYLAGIAAGVFAAALAGAALWTATQKAEGQAITTVQLPAATVTSVSNTAVQIVAQNPGRRSYSICNGSANAIFALPSTTGTGLTTSGGGVPIAVSTCLTPPPNLLQSGTAGGGGQSWWAIGVSAGPTVVAFIEW